MKLNELKTFEMTMKAANLSPMLKNYFEQISANPEEFQHIGDMQDIQINKKDTVFLFTKDSKQVGFVQVKFIDSSKIELQNVYTDMSFRGNRLLEKFIWFLKVHEHYTQIIMGDVHSNDSFEALKGIAQRFDSFWVKGDEKIPYNPDDIQNYYGSEKPTGWKLVFENNNGKFENWPRFYDPNVLNVKQNYDWIIEEINW